MTTKTKRSNSKPQVPGLVDENLYEVLLLDESGFVGRTDIQGVPLREATSAVATFNAIMAAHSQQIEWAVAVPLLRDGRSQFPVPPKR